VGYLLDTSTLVDVLRGDVDVRRRLLDQPPRTVHTCSVVRAELVAGCGLAREPMTEHAKVERLLRPLLSLPFDDAAADAYGSLRAILQRAGSGVGSNDLMIASIALARQLTLVTSNTREFARIPGLAVEDWRAAA